MTDSERERRVYRDAGLAKVRAWTRGCVAAGVVLSGVVGAGLAHVLPGQAAVVKRSSPPPATAPRQSDSTSAAPGAASSQPSQGNRHHHPRRFAPPSTAPSPAGTPTHVTSGGS
ncbi:MAG TPA: hypothetical protein VGD53_10325 [Actinoallomurus sp.]